MRLHLVRFFEGEPPAAKQATQVKNNRGNSRRAKREPKQRQTRASKRTNTYMVLMARFSTDVNTRSNSKPPSRNSRPASRASAWPEGRREELGAFGDRNRQKRRNGRDGHETTGGQQQPSFAHQRFTALTLVRQRHVHPAWTRNKTPNNFENNSHTHTHTDTIFIAPVNLLARFHSLCLQCRRLQAVCHIHTITHSFAQQSGQNTKPPKKGGKRTRDAS